MPTTQQIKLDGRSKRYNKNTMVRHTLKMGSKTLTLIKYTDKSNTGSPYWQAKCFIGGKTRQKTTKEEDLKKAEKVAIDWMADLMTADRRGIPLVNTPNRFSSVAESVLKKMDRILVISEGAVESSGTFEELLTSSKIFSRLVSE